MMPSASAISVFLLLALAGGFVFAYLWERSRYISLRSEGQRLYFLAAVYAIPLVIASHVIVWLLSLVPTDELPRPLVKWVGKVWGGLTGPFHSDALSTFLLAFLLGATIPLLLNMFDNRQRLSGNIILKYGSQLEKFFYETITHQLPVSVSLDNRKVYVGYVWRLAPLDPHRVGDYAVRLLPIRSGYRDEKTLELHFTTRYTEVYRRIGTGELQGVKREDFLVVLPVKNIVSANLFALWIDRSLLRIPST